MLRYEIISPVTGFEVGMVISAEQLPASLGGAARLIRLNAIREYQEPQQASKPAPTERPTSARTK